MIVVDTNILLDAVGPAESSAWIDELTLRDAEWLAPPLWRSEFRNALAGYMRRDILQPEQAERMILEAAQLLQKEMEPRDDLVLHHVRSTTCTAYDLEFVVVAEELSIRLVTFDKQILREFPAIALTPQQFLAR